MINKFLNQEGLSTLISLIKQQISKISFGLLVTNKTESQETSNGESLNGVVNLHKISKTGNYNDLLNKPVIPTKTSQLQNDNGFIAIESDPTVPQHVKEITRQNIVNWNNKLDSETDPTVPSHVKNITQEDINNWNNKLDSYTEVDPSVPNYVRNITQEDIQNWNNKLDSFTESDPTVPSHVKSITITDINNWNNKVDTSDLATVATSGSYNDLANKPTIPAAQVNSDWNAVSGVAAILNKPTIPDTAQMVTKKMLDEYCPIIEDTRTSGVAAVTGVAPFGTLVDGQRIMLKVTQMIPVNPTLTLTLSDNTTVGPYPMYTNYQSTPLSAVWNNNIRAGSYIELLYESTDDRWVMVGQRDSNTTYQGITQAEITAGTITSQRVVTPKLLVDNFGKKHTYVDNSADASVELSVATYNDLGTLSTWKTITLPAAYNRGDEFVFRFECGDASLSPALPAGVVLADGFDFAEMAVGVTYQVSIMDGVAAYLVITPNS